MLITSSLVKSFFGNVLSRKQQIKVSGFELWITIQGFATCGDVDVLRDIYEAMDDDDK